MSLKQVLDDLRKNDPEWDKKEAAMMMMVIGYKDQEVSGTNPRHWLDEQIKKDCEYRDQQKEIFIEKYLRLNAAPAIKGKITRGKLKWRGIKFAECLHIQEFWILQRGKQISPKLKFIVEVKIK